MNITPLRSMTSLRLASLVVLAAGSLAVPASVAAAQPAGDPLSGPKVRERDVPGAAPDFGGKETGKYRPREIPPQMFLEALKQTLGESAPEAIRATPEQMEKVRGYFEEHRKAAEAYIREHRDELGKINARTGEPRAEKGKPAKKPAKGEPAQAEPKPDPEMRPMTEAETEMDPAMAQRRQAILDGMPKVGDLYTKVWAVLSDAQHAAVQTRLDAMKEKMQAEANERQVRRLADKKTPKPGAGEPAQPEAPKRPKAKGSSPAAEPTGSPEAKPVGTPDGKPARMTPVSPETRERFMRLLERLSPEEREQLLKRLEERMRERAAGDAAGPKRGNARGGQGDAKPAPSVDSLNLPKPEGREGSKN